MMFGTVETQSPMNADFAKQGLRDRSPMSVPETVVLTVKLLLVYTGCSMSPLANPDSICRGAKVKKKNAKMDNSVT